MDIYEKVIIERALKKLNYKDLGAIIEMSGEAFRMAVKRKSLSNLQIREIENFFELKNTNTDRNSSTYNENDFLREQLKIKDEQILFYIEQINYFKNKAEESK